MFGAFYPCNIITAERLKTPDVIKPKENYADVRTTWNECRIKYVLSMLIEMK